MQSEFRNNFEFYIKLKNLGDLDFHDLKFMNVILPLNVILREIPL